MPTTYFESDSEERRLRRVSKDEAIDLEIALTEIYRANRDLPASLLLLLPERQ